MQQQDAGRVERRGERPEETRGLIPNAVEVRGLRKKFGRSDALKGLDLQVPTGAVYALLGRNGAGKSTLIQLLLGLLDPDAGQVRVLQLDPVRNGVDLRRRVGYIPERLPMYERMTVGRQTAAICSVTT